MINILSSIYDDYLIYAHILVRLPLYLAIFWSIKQHKGQRLLWAMGAYGALFIATGGK